MTTTNTPERQRRIAEVWQRNQHLTEAEVHEAVDRQLAAEAVQQAEGQRWADEMAASAIALTACGVPGCGNGKTPRTGLCEAHSRVLYVIEAETAGAEPLPDGRTVRDWITDLAAERRAP